jgi:hypothetical protein
MVTAPPAGDEEVQAMTEHQRESEWNVADWHGKMLVDCNGGKIGELQDVYVDVETDEPHRSFLSCAFSPSQPTPAKTYDALVNQPLPRLPRVSRATSSVAATDDRAAIRA